MIAFHKGNGQLVVLASFAKEASKVSFNDNVAHIGASNVQQAIVQMKLVYFPNKFPGWLIPTSVNNAH